MEKINKTIFIAEDDIDFLEQTKLYLSNKGYSVITAKNENDAYEIIANEKFDLAILDLMMDNQDTGFVLAYKIKKKDSKVPIIIITAVSKEKGYQFSVANQKDKTWIKADVILHKDIRLEQLVFEINQLLNMQ